MWARKQLVDIPNMSKVETFCRGYVFRENEEKKKKKRGPPGNPSSPRQKKTQCGRTDRGGHPRFPYHCCFQAASLVFMVCRVRVLISWIRRWNSCSSPKAGSRCSWNVNFTASCFVMPLLSIEVFKASVGWHNWLNASYRDFRSELMHAPN